MVLIFGGLLSVLLTDEHVVIVEELVLGKKVNVTDTKQKHRDAVLQFGLSGDHPVHTELITFFVTASKVEMSRFIKGGLDTLQCEVRRYRTNGTVRWPSLEATEDDNWFTCTLRHLKGLFVVTAFLRHSPRVPNVIHPGFKWIPVADKDIISTKAVMMVWSSTPSVNVSLNREKTLNCEFSIDHKGAHLTVEWHLLRHGHHSKLFSYSSRTGKSEGSGVSVKAVDRGNASLNIPLTRAKSEGTYICSVQVPPLSSSHNIVLQVMEPPHVSISVNSEVSLTEGEFERVDCEAQGFYPLDVFVRWLKVSQTPGERQVPEVLNTQNIVKQSSHRHNRNGTYSVTTYFLLKPTLQDSGYLYTCSVSHDALQMPILKNFTLRVTLPKVPKDLYINP